MIKSLGQPGPPSVKTFILKPSSNNKRNSYYSEIKIKFCLNNLKTFHQRRYTKNRLTAHEKPQIRNITRVTRKTGIQSGRRKMSECLKHLRVVAHLQSQPQMAETATEENFQPQVSTGTYEEVYTLTQETQTHGT